MNLMDGLFAAFLAKSGSSAATGGSGQTVAVSGSAPSIAAADNSTYVCGELTGLTVSSLPASGLFEIVFQSGSTATQVTLPENVLLPDSVSIEANSIYDVSIRVCAVGGSSYGLAAVQGWPVPTA